MDCQSKKTKKRPNEEPPLLHGFAPKTIDDFLVYENADIPDNDQSDGRFEVLPRCPSPACLLA